MILNRLVARLLDGLARGCSRLADEVRGADPDVEPEDDLGEDEPFEGTVASEAARLRVVRSPRPRAAEAAPEPLKGSVAARLAHRRPRW